MTIKLSHILLLSGISILIVLIIIGRNSHSFFSRNPKIVNIESNTTDRITTTRSDPNYSYLFNETKNKLPVLVWIPGGGLSSFVFAFSGIGPYLIKDNKAVDNPYKAPNSQLFLDVGGLGYSDHPKFSYKTSDHELIKEYVKYLSKILSNKPKNIILAGVSYGGKLAILLNEALKHTNIEVHSLILITPYIDPYHSMAFIPERVINISRLNDTDTKYYENLKTSFQSSINQRDFPSIKTYMDSDGLFTKFVQKKLNIKELNLWDIRNYNKPTLGNWEIPRKLKEIQNFLITNNISHLFDETYNISNPLINSEYMMNDSSWEILAWTTNSYMVGVHDNLRNIKIPVKIFSGTDDIITSYIGLSNIQQETYNPNIEYFILQNGPHLSIMLEEFAAKILKQI